MEGQSSRRLDLNDALGDASAPPLPFPGGSFELISAPTAFMRMHVGWAEWLLEARRLLDEGGLLLVGLANRTAFERLTGESWDPARIGMTVLAGPEGPGSRVVFHSEWWLRAHWGRAFEVIAIDEGEAGRLARLKKRLDPASARGLELRERGDERELEAASANVEYLRSQLDRLERRHRSELEEQREALSRELMRRSFAVADLDWARNGPGSPAMLVAAEYEATTSWRLTKPLRAMGSMLRRLK